MPSAHKNVRISASTAVVLRRLSERLNQSQTALVERALLDLERQVFWEQSAAALDRLRSDPAAWNAYQSEVRSLDGWRGGSHSPITPEEEEAW